MQGRGGGQVGRGRVPAQERHLPAEVLEGAEAEERRDEHADEQLVQDPPLALRRQ